MLIMLHQSEILCVVDCLASLPGAHLSPQLFRRIHLCVFKRCECFAVATLQYQFLIRNFVLQLVSMSFKPFQTFVSQNHFMTFFLMFTFLEFVAHTYTRTHALMRPLLPSIAAVAFIYLQWYSVSRAFCYAMRTMISLFSEVASSTARMEIGQKWCFMQAYVRVCLKRVCICG